MTLRHNLVRTKKSQTVRGGFMTTKTGDLMSKKLIATTVGTSVAAAAQLMEDKRIRHLPVVDEAGDIIGVFSKRDFTSFETLLEFNVEHLMTAPVEFVSYEMPVRNAVFRMLESKISSLIIVDAKDEAIGIITTDDMLWHLAALMKNDEESSDQLLSAGTLQTIGQVAHQMASLGF
jgi:CBS domain-containing protein